MRAGDAVDFTVLAYPNRTFHATVQQVRQNPTTVSNVVTYQTVVIVNNKDGALRPGMTANATIQVAHVDNATIVPLAAFSYAPPSGSVTRTKRSRGASARHVAGAAGATARVKRSAARRAGSGAAGNSASPWGQTSAASSGAVTPGGTGRIFVQRGSSLVPVRVKIGLVADTQASVTPLRGTLSANDQVVIGDSSSASGSKSASGGNPLDGRQPARRRGGRRGPLGGG